MSDFGPLSVRERAQRELLAAQLAAGRRTVAVTITPDGSLPLVADAAASLRIVPIDAFLTEPPDAAVDLIVAIDGAGHVDGRDLVRAIQAWITNDAAVVLALPDGPSSAMTEAERAWPDARGLQQRLVELSVLKEDGDVQCIDAAGVPKGDHRSVRWTVLVHGAPRMSLAVPWTATTGMNARYQAALQRANDHLEAANARLRQNAASKESASAASLQARAQLVERELRRELDDALAGARQNDELFQEARRTVYAQADQIALLQGRFGARVRRRVERLPGAHLALRIVRAGKRVTRRF